MEQVPQEFLDYVRYVNEEDYFEAHEVLESLWHSDRIDFYKGMIQVAVAIFHLRNGNTAGSRWMFRRARQLLTPYLPVFRQIDVERVTAYIDDCLDKIPHVNEMERDDVDKLNIQGIRLQLMEDEN